jgi:hypothetical protein
MTRAVALLLMMSCGQGAKPVPRAPLSLVEGGPFEGEITLSVTAANTPPHTLVIVLKGTRMRYGMTDVAHLGFDYAIIDASSKQLTFVNNTTKVAMITPMVHEGTQPAIKSTVERTGQTGVVAGYACEVWNIRTESEHTEACVAPGLAFPDFGSPREGWMKEVEGFPLRSVTTDSTGKETHRLEATKIDKKPLDAAQFAPPPGYQTVNSSH